MSEQKFYQQVVLWRNDNAETRIQVFTAALFSAKLDITHMSISNYEWTNLQYTHNRAPHCSGGGSDTRLNEGGQTSEGVPYESFYVHF